MSEFDALPQTVDIVEEDNDAADKASASTKRKAKKQEKKLGRKQAQYKRVLEELGVAFTDASTPYLFVANGGLDNGVDRESLVALFSRHGVLQRVLMPKHKAYALLEFSSGGQAACARAALTGAVLDLAASTSAVAVARSPLYVLHMSAMPRHCPCEDGDAAAFSAAPPRGLRVLRDFVDADEEQRLVEYFGGGLAAAAVVDGARDPAESSDVRASVGRATDRVETTHDGDAARSSDTHAAQQQQRPVAGPESVRGSLKHRHVRHYGYEFRYGTNDVDPTRPLRRRDDALTSVSGLPPLLDGILLRLVSGVKSAAGEAIATGLPDQLTVNDYHPGQGIPPHVDTSWAFEDAIFSLSLLSAVVMDFRHADGRHVPMWLPRRSLLVMSGESRYSWSHGITPRKMDCIPASLLGTAAAGGSASSAGVAGLTLVQRCRRLSLTLRKIIKVPQRPPVAAAAGAGKENSGPAANGAPSQSQFVAPTTEEEAVEMETKHVYEVYDSIASHFSSTRHTPWPRVVEFLNRLAPGSFVLDVGCGNGKYMNVNPRTVSIGCDRSIGLTSIAKDRDLNVAVADILNLPYRADFFDACICIAVVHHLVTRDRRLRALRELLRVVRPGGGEVLVYVWAQEQEKCAAKGRKKNADAAAAATALEPGTQAQAREAQRDNFRQQDVLVPWKFAEPGKKTKKVAAKSRTASVSSASSSTAAGDACGADAAPGDGSTASSSAAVARIDEDESSVAAGRHSPGGGPTGVAGSPDVVASPALADGSAAAVAARSGEVYQRFYHVFVRSELEELCRELSDVAELREYYHDKGNWCAVLRKR